MERGILGGAGLLVLIVAIAWRARTLVRRPQGPALRSVMPYTAPIVGAVVGMAIFATNEQVLHFRQVWALFAVVAAYHLWAGEPFRPLAGRAPARPNGSAKPVGGFVRP